jgi:hypothetical protein
MTLPVADNRGHGRRPCVPARARMQGSSPRMDRVSRLVNLGTRARGRPSSRSADNRGVPLWHELGCYAGAGSAVAKVFADGLGRAGSKQRGAVALIDRAGASSSPPSSSRMDGGRRVNGWEPTEGRIIAGRRLVSGVGIGAGAAGAVPLIPFTSLRGLFGDCVASGGCGLRSSIATRCAPRPGLFGETG